MASNYVTIKVSANTLESIAYELGKWERASDRYWDKAESATDETEKARFTRKMDEADNKQFGMFEVLSALGFSWKGEDDEKGRVKYTIFAP